MTAQEQVSSTQTRESPKATSITLKDLLERLRRGVWVTIWCCVAALLASVLYIATATPKYSAQMMVAPPLQSMPEGAGAGSQAASLLGLGSMFSSQNESFRYYVELLTSRVVAARLERDHHVLRIVFYKQWDAQHQRWNPPGLLSRMRAALLQQPLHAAPDIDDLTDFIDNNVRVDIPASNSPLSTPSPVRLVSFTFHDPAMTAQLLLWVHQEADGIIRESELQRTRATIDYLKVKLQSVQNTDEHYALTQLLINEEKSEMLLTTNIDFSAIVLGPPGRPEIPSSPRPAMTIILALLGGLVLGLVISAMRNPERTTGRSRGRVSRLFVPATRLANNFGASVGNVMSQRKHYDSEHIRTK